MRKIEPSCSCPSKTPNLITPLTVINLISLINKFYITVTEKIEVI